MKSENVVVYSDIVRHITTIQPRNANNKMHVVTTMTTKRCETLVDAPYNICMLYVYIAHPVQ